MSVSLPPEVIEQARRQYERRLANEKRHEGWAKCDVWVAHKGPHQCQQWAATRRRNDKRLLCGHHLEASKHREIAFNAEDAIRIHNARRDVLEIER